MAAETRKKRRSVRSYFLLSLFLCASAAALSCGSKPTDLRTLVPAETLVYLETNDLGAALQPIIDSKPFNEVAKKKPDLSALKGVQLAVAITGFETSEEKLTDEHSVGKIQPHFVAVADTHAWHFQAVGFAEKKIGAFVAQIYDSEPTLEKPEKNGGRYLTWTAQDGRKAYAFVIGSIIYFSNDETAIDKCLAVSRGESDSIVKTGKVQPADPTTLASGYISTDGVAQIANLAALKFASDASDESEVQSAIAGIIPGLIRGTVTDVTWMQTKTDAGIEDKWQVNMPSEIGNVFAETMKPADKVDSNIVTQLPDSISSATIYNFNNPQIAYRSGVVVAQKATGLNDRAMKTISEIFLLPYSIKDAEKFLAATVEHRNPHGNTILTARIEADDEPVVIAAAGASAPDFLASLQPKFKPPAKIIEGAESNTWSSTEDDTVVRFDLGSLLIGPKDEIVRCSALTNYRPLPDSPENPLTRIASTKASIASSAHDGEVSTNVAAFFGEVGDGAQATSGAFTETRFNKSGMERKTTSDFGFIGWIIAQLNEE